MDIQVKKLWLIEQILHTYDEKVIDRVKKALQKKEKNVNVKSEGQKLVVQPEKYPKLDYSKYKFKSKDLHFNRDEINER